MMMINNMKCEQHTAAGLLHGTLTKVYVKDYQSSMQQHSIVDFTLSRGYTTMNRVYFLARTHKSNNRHDGPDLLHNLGN